MFAGFAIVLLLAQGTPSFEVADVKVNNSGEARMAVDFQPGGRLSMHSVTMKVMIQMSYHVRPDAVTGGPAWLDSERYDVVAKASQTTSQDDLRRMLQTLLSERFKLTVHADRKAMPAYSMTALPSGLKLKASDAALLTDQRCGPGAGEPGVKHVVCRHITMAALADTLQEIAARDIDIPVVDETGIAGAYDFNLDWAPTGPTVFEAVEIQLGLRLERKKLPLPIIVIDRVERAPTEN